MEQLDDEMYDKRPKYLLKLEELASVLGVHVNEAITLVETELLPYSYKYILLCKNSAPESRVREEDIRFMLPK